MRIANNNMQSENIPISSSISDEIDINLVDLAKICDLSYRIKNDIMYSPEENEKELFEKISKSILSIDCNIDSIQAISCISIDKKILIISIAGSNDVQDFLYNLDAAQIFPYDEAKQTISEEIRFHKGFYVQFMDMLDNIKMIVDEFRGNGDNIIICGHSMGGCIASIISFYLKKMDIFKKTQVVTFGAPVFTNVFGARWFEDSVPYTRVQIDKDPIPKLPIDSRYWHVSKTHIYIKNKRIIINVNDQRSQGCIQFFKNLFIKKIDLKYHNIKEYIDELISL